MKISIVVATSLDGKIAKDEMHFPNWTGNCDKNIFKFISEKFEVIIMGYKSFITFNKILPNRKIIVLTKNKKIINMNLGFYQFKKKIIFSKKSPDKIINVLRKNNHKKILICGGSQINFIFAKKTIVNEVIITFCPLIFGKGISIFSKFFRTNLNLNFLNIIEKNYIYGIYKLTN